MYKPVYAEKHQTMVKIYSSMQKDGPGPVMVSNTLCPAVHIVGTENMYSYYLGQNYKDA